MPELAGSRVIPGYSPPDLVYILVILRTIRKLKRNGFHLILKKSPKHVISRRFDAFDSLVDEISEDYFFPKVTDQADAFILFYAGSAFCEALLSMKPIVYIHLPFRTADPWARSKLEKCLCWIDCDDNDGLQVDLERMIYYLNGDCYETAQRRVFVEKNYLSS